MRTVHLLSVVIPCFNEEDVLVTTHERLISTLSSLVSQHHCQNYEIVLVNNGSTDNTQAIMMKLFKKDPHIVVVQLRRNFGYQASITAGLEHAIGDVVISIDADLQDPPEKIPDMIALYNQGYDLVLGIRKSRATDDWFKRTFSQLFYKFLKSLGVDVVYNHGDFRLMARELLDQFKDMTERSRFIRAMILYLDNHYAQVYYDRDSRKQGHTKFNLYALFSLALDGIFSFSNRPLRFLSLFGLSMSLLSLLMALWVIYIKVKTNVMVGWASTLLPIVFFGGIQTLFLGIIGEYVGRLYIEVKQRPLYAIRSISRHEKN